MATALGELRQIEDERQAEVHAAAEAVRAAAQQERARRAVAAAEEVVAEAARVQAARSEVEAAWSARWAQVAAELAATVEVERTRCAVALAAQRSRAEYALRCEIVRRQRPRWLIAVAATALLVASGAAWFAIDQGQHAADDRRAVAAALAVREAKQAQARVDALEAELLAREAAKIRAAPTPTNRTKDDRVRYPARRSATLVASPAAATGNAANRPPVVKIPEACLRNALCDLDAP